MWKIYSGSCEMPDSMEQQWELDSVCLFWQFIFLQRTNISIMNHYHLKHSCLKYLEMFALLKKKAGLINPPKAMWEQSIIRGWQWGSFLEGFMNLYVNVVIIAVMHRNKEKKLWSLCFFQHQLVIVQQSRGEKCFGDIKRYKNINGIKLVKYLRIPYNNYTVPEITA